MNQETKDRLEKAGWVETTVADFLNLTPEEEALVDTGLVLSNMMKEAREAHHLSPAEVEARVGLKAGQVAELEGAVGLDFGTAFHVLYALGISPREIGERLAPVELKRAELVA